MAGFFRKICAVILAAILCLTVGIPALASETDTKPYVQQILNYYLHYQEQAQTDIDALLSKMAAVDWQHAMTWEKIIDNWTWIYNDMQINTDVLPDGLPEDDSLCIVALGFRLSSSGYMLPELEERMEVVLRSAKKYPNAYILCAGGPTSDRGNITEAQVMAKWLTDRGIEENRLILETESMSTTENACNAYRILNADYPEIQSIALVTSDYHIARSTLMFSAVSLYESGYYGNRSIPVVSNAVCRREQTGNEELYMQAWGLAILAGVEIYDLPEPELSQLTNITVQYDGEVDVTAHYDSGVEQNVSERSCLIVSNPEKEDSQKITVTYEENGITATQSLSLDQETPVQTAEAVDNTFFAVLAITIIWFFAVLIIKWRGYLQ